MGICWGSAVEASPGRAGVSSERELSLSPAGATSSPALHPVPDRRPRPAWLASLQVDVLTCHDSRCTRGRPVAFWLIGASSPPLRVNGTAQRARRGHVTAVVPGFRTPVVCDPWLIVNGPLHASEQSDVSSPIDCCYLLCKQPTLHVVGGLSNACPRHGGLSPSVAPLNKT